MSFFEYNHPLREQLTRELHSRPFLSIDAPSRIAYFAATHSAERDQNAPYKALLDFCNQFAIDPPQAVTSYFVRETDFGMFKWERHTEFSTYMFVENAPTKTSFDPQRIVNIPDSWFAEHDIEILVSAVIDICPRHANPTSKIIDEFRRYFVPEAFSVAGVLENAAYIMSDFRPDTNGHVRFVILPFHGTGPKRIGRIVQRVVEIETYLTATLLALPQARQVSQKVPALGRELPILLSQMHQGRDGVLTAFNALLEISSQTETLLADTDYRFSAAQAYATLVTQRLSILREERVAGFQMVSEFLLRRFDPSVRTINSSRQQLRDFAERVERASNLLRTQIDVNDASAQQELLAAMNKRGETQLRLQETVEGFSVVAISYYAISLLGYIGAPIAKALHIDKSILLALAVPPTVLLVWYFINRIKKRVNAH